MFHSPPESPFQIYLHSLPLLQPVATLYSASPEKLGNDSTPLIQAVRAERFSPAFLHQLSSRIKYMSPGAASDAVGAYLNLAEQTLSADRSFLWLDALGAALSAAPSSLAERHGHLLSNLQASSYPDKHRLFAARLLCALPAQAQPGVRSTQPFSPKDESRTALIHSAIGLSISILNSSKSGHTRTEALTTLIQFGSNTCLDAIAQYAADLIRRKGITICADSDDEANLVTAVSVLDASVDRRIFRKADRSGCIFAVICYVVLASFGMYVLWRSLTSVFTGLFLSAALLFVLSLTVWWLGVFWNSLHLLRVAKRVLDHYHRSDSIQVQHGKS